MKKNIIIGIALLILAITLIFITPFFPFDEIAAVILALIAFSRDMLK